MTDYNSDFLIIGAGIVGMAIALKLKESFPEKKVVVLEKNPAPFMETSRHNSGVIHTGIHQKANLLKSKLARRGAPLLKEFCREQGILFRETAMLVAVSKSDFFSLIREALSLIRLGFNARRQGIKIKFLTSAGINEREPNLRASFGILIPDIWVVDQNSLGAKMHNLAVHRGIEFFFGAAAENIERTKNYYQVGFEGGDKFFAETVINCAGLMADKIAEKAGFGQYKIYPYRGEYYEIMDSNLVKALLVYPAIPPGSPVKGIHLTKTAAGRLLIGPNSSYWPSRKDDFNVRTSPDEFYKAVKKFLPKLKQEDLRWAYSGLRPKINQGVGEDDFIIKKETSEPPHFINLIGIESPGFAAAFAIANYVFELYVSF